MAASTSRQPRHTTTLPGSSEAHASAGKTTASLKGKGRETFQHQSPGSSWDELGSDAVWDWISLTDPSASKVPPVFTKDGRYCHHVLSEFKPFTTYLASQLLLLTGRVFRQNSFCGNWPCCFNSFLTARRWDVGQFAHIGRPEPTQCIPTNYWLFGRASDGVGFFGCYTLKSHRNRATDTPYLCPRTVQRLCFRVGHAIRQKNKDE